MKRCAAFMLVCATLPVTTWGAQPTAGRLQSWFDGELEQVDEPISLENLCIAYRMEWHDVPSAEELRTLRAAVARHPDHPGAQTLRVYERRLKEGPSIERFKVWIGADGSWRRSNLPAISHPVKEPTDTAWTPAVAWVMGRDYLTIADPRKDSSGAYNYGSLIDEFRRWIGFAQNGGLMLIHELDLDPGAVSFEADRWSVEGSREHFGTMRFTWVWDHGADRGLVQEVLIVDAPASPSEVGSRYTMTGWHEEPLLGSWIASRVDNYRPDGRLAQAFVLEGIEVADGAFIDRITAAPAFTGTDPIRGPVAFTTVQDRRSGTDLYASIDRSEPGAKATTSTDGSGATPSGLSLDWRWVGWACAGVIVVVLVVLRIGQGT